MFNLVAQTINVKNFLSNFVGLAPLADVLRTRFYSRVMKLHNLELFLVSTSSLKSLAQKL